MTETPELITALTAAIDALAVGWKAESRAGITATARYFFYEGVKAERAVRDNESGQSVKSNVA